MKQKIGSVLAVSTLLLGTSAFGSEVKAKNVFRCVAKADIYNISITVQQLPSGQYQSLLEGSTFDEPVPTTRVELNRENGIRRYGVSDVANTVKLTKAEYAKTAKIVVYEAGNFHDDAAGVLGIEFLDSSSTVIKSGMYFAWAGPQACLSEL